MKSLIPSLFAAWALAASSQAAVLVQYGFNTGSDDTATTTGTGVTPSTFTSSVASVYTTTDTPAGGRARATALSNVTNDFDSATAAYYQFSIAPTTPGQALDLTNLTFVFNVSATVTGGECSYRLRYALPSDPTTFFVVGITNTSNGITASSADFDLSGAAFDNLSGIIFRLDMKDSGSTASTSLRIDNVTVNGTVIPEPSSAVLLLGAVGLLGIRRRR